MSFRSSMAATLLVMACANVATHRFPGGVTIGLTLTAALAVIARASGLGASDLGLARATWPAGLRWGAACAAVAAVGYGLAYVIPATRNAVAGTADTSWSQALWAVFVVIPLGTVLPEEFAFRGVLWGLLRRQSGRRVATLVSSALFGLWHIAPALGGGPANQVVSDAVGGGTAGVVFRVIGTVLFTGVAGLLLAELRSRSDSLIAPMMLHWAVNGIGEVFVHLA